MTVAEFERQMGEVLDEAGLVTPTIPPCVQADSAGSGPAIWEDWAWRSHPEVDPWWAYFGAGRGLAEDIPLDAVDGDFFLFAHRGHGVNSHAVGLVARIGALVIDQQELWGGGYLDSAESTAKVNRATTVWNEQLPSLLETRADAEPSTGYVHLRYSGFRGAGRVTVAIPGVGEFTAGERPVPSELAPALEAARAYLRELEGEPDGLSDTRSDSRGVLAPSVVFALFRAPGEAVLVGHDGDRSWCIAPEKRSAAVDDLERMLADSSTVGVHTRLRAGDDWPGWAVTSLDLEEYLLVLVGLVLTGTMLDEPTSVRVFTDTWNGVEPLARLLGDLEDSWPPADYLPWEVSPDAAFADLPALSPSLIPGGFSAWRLTAPTSSEPTSEPPFDVPMEWSIPPSVILSHSIFGGLAWRPEFDTPALIGLVQEEIDAIDLGAGALAFVQEARKVRRRAVDLYVAALEAQLDDATAELRQQRQLTRRAPGVHRGRSRRGPVTRFRRWLADQIRKAG